MYRVFTTALLAATSVSALTISNNCQTALGQISANAEANACLDVSALLSVAIQPNASIITPVDNLLKSLCAAAPCSNATLSAVVTNITTGCSAELSSVNSTESSTSGTNCITQTLTNLQSTVGTLSLSNLDALTSIFTSSNALPRISLARTQAYNVLNDDFPSTASTGAGALQSECGSDFTSKYLPVSLPRLIPNVTDGNTPSNIKEIARGALAGLTASLLVAGSSLWMVLA
ncbi:hypothetical protein FB45DRAFT_892752 [Roridomyces roridus]|uniref:Uncharacterized protein n=1 Tax=Roridomyces roridus TaxID=1738132 RepID=A0AAD7FZZ9_9AGAR|nr:hypothetical protein FB45DRAFT_892752 [Roridomyces roridus]